MARYNGSILVDADLRVRPWVHGDVDLYNGSILVDADLGVRPWVRIVFHVTGVDYETMFRNPEARRKLAILAIVLGVVFIIGVIWSVLSGETEWWTLILILPAAAIMRKLSGIAAGSVRRRPPRRAASGEVPETLGAERDSGDGTSRAQSEQPPPARNQKSEP